MNYATQSHVKLSSGHSFPKMALGTYKLSPGSCTEAVYNAIKVGYRHIDGAGLYGNEVEVGRGINKAIEDGICTREDLWITSKLWNTFHAYEHVKPAIMRTLSDLNLTYLDLYLIHFPVPLKYVDPVKDRYPSFWNYEADNNQMVIAKVPLKETWTAMEELVKEGLTRTIGVSNFTCLLIQDMLTYVNIKPVVNQVEFHPYLVQSSLVKYCSSVDIVVTAYSPFGGIAYIEVSKYKEDEPEVIKEDTIVQIAKTHNRSPAQIVLKWCVQFNPMMAVTAKSSKLERLKENLDIFSFVLSEEEMQAINNLNQNKRYNDVGYFCEKLFGAICPIFD